VQWGAFCEGDAGPLGSALLLKMFATQQKLGDLHNTPLYSANPATQIGFNPIRDHTNSLEGPPGRSPT
jgi:hypothetical protein